MKQLHLRNSQRARKLKLEPVRRAARVLLDALLALESYELGVHFVSPVRMARINRDYLNHEGSTDVITFDYRDGGPTLRGEIFISVADAMENGKRFSRPWDEEIVRYLIHGTLHLLGYDDLEPSARRKMKAAENRLLRRVLAAL